jgi:hypothetical protein
MVEFAGFLPQRQRTSCAHGALNAETADFCFTVKLKSAPIVTSEHGVPLPADKFSVAWSANSSHSPNSFHHSPVDDGGSDALRGRFEEALGWPLLWAGLMGRLAILLAGIVIGGLIAQIPFLNPPPVRYTRYVFVTNRPGMKYPPGAIVDCDFDCLPMARQAAKDEAQWPHPPLMTLPAVGNLLRWSAAKGISQEINQLPYRQEPLREGAAFLFAGTAGPAGDAALPVIHRRIMLTIRINPKVAPIERRRIIVAVAGNQA